MVSDNAIRCLFCAVSFTEENPPEIYCDDCDAPYHQDCWDAQGGCSRMGCKNAPIRKPKQEKTELIINEPSYSTLAKLWAAAKTRWLTPIQKRLASVFNYAKSLVRHPLSTETMALDKASKVAWFVLGTIADGIVTSANFVRDRLCVVIFGIFFMIFKLCEAIIEAATMLRDGIKTIMHLPSLVYKKFVGAYNYLREMSDEGGVIIEEQYACRVEAKKSVEPERS